MCRQEWSIYANWTLFPQLDDAKVVKASYVRLRVANRTYALNYSFELN